VAAQCQRTRITNWTGAGSEGAAIELAEETDIRLGVREAEAGAVLVVGLVGVEVMEGVGGGVVSIVQVKLAALL
jgi:hypothetical protein